MHVVFIVTPNCCWGGKKCIIIDYTQFLKCEVGNKGKSCWRGKKGRNRNERVELDAWTVGSCGFISDVLKNLLLGSMSSSIILLGGGKNVIHYFLCAFIFSLFTECRVMKGPKAQRGSAKSPGPIKRCKSPAESSEPDTSHLHSSPSLFQKQPTTP